MTKLPLPDGVRTKVFRAFVNLLRHDPVLKRTIKPLSWYVWDGRPDPKPGTFASGELPAIRLTPLWQHATPETLTRQSSPLSIQIDIAVDGTNIDDALNLWEAIEAVVFTGDGSARALSALRAAAPAPNNVLSLRLVNPAITPTPAGLVDNLILCEGHILIELMIKK